jgi:hypothetical protein
MLEITNLIASKAATHNYAYHWMDAESLISGSNLI